MLFISSSSMVTQCSIYYCDAIHFTSCELLVDYTHANYFKITLRPKLIEYCASYIHIMLFIHTQAHAITLKFH